MISSISIKLNGCVKRWVRGGREECDGDEMSNASFKLNPITHEANLVESALISRKSQNMARVFIPYPPPVTH